MIKRFIKRIVKEVLREVSDTPLDETGKYVVLKDKVVTLRDLHSPESIGETVTKIIKEQRAVRRMVLDVDKQVVRIW